MPAFVQFTEYDPSGTTEVKLPSLRPGGHIYYDSQAPATVPPVPVPVSSQNLPEVHTPAPASEPGSHTSGFSDEDTVMLDEEASVSELSSQTSRFSEEDSVMSDAAGIARSPTPMSFSEVPHPRSLSIFGEFPPNEGKESSTVQSEEESISIVLRTINDRDRYTKKASSNKSTSFSFSGVHTSQDVAQAYRLIPHSEVPYMSASNLAGTNMVVFRSRKVQNKNVFTRSFILRAYQLIDHPPSVLPGLTFQENDIFVAIDVNAKGSLPPGTRKSSYLKMWAWSEASWQTITHSTIRVFGEYTLALDFIGETEEPAWVNPASLRKKRRKSVKPDDGTSG